MKLIGLMPCRNEDWILGLTARAALQWMDGLVILAHCCTDGTHQIVFDLVAEYDKPICIIAEGDPVWHEQAHRQMMLDAAHRVGATHIATIDADELLTGNLLPDIREMIEILSPGEVLQLPWLATRKIDFRKPMQFIPDRVDPFVTVAWKDDPRFNYSAEIRNGYDYHRRHPFCTGGPGYQQFAFPLSPYKQGGVMHLQFLSRRRLLAKHALYQMQEAIRWPGKFMGNPDPEATAKVRAMYGHTVARLDNDMLPCPAEWWAPYSDLLKHMNVFEEPWQVAECKRLMKQHGPERFQGLDLYGVLDAFTCR